MAQFGSQAVSGLGSGASGPLTSSTYQAYNQALPETFSIFNQGSQNLSAPALASLLGAVYQPPGGTPYAPGPDYYRELLEIQRMAANRQGVADPFSGMNEMLAGLLEAQQVANQPQQATVSAMDLVGGTGWGNLDDFLGNGLVDLAGQFQDQGMKLNPYQNPYVKVDPFLKPNSGGNYGFPDYFNPFLNT